MLNCEFSCLVMEYVATKVTKGTISNIGAREASFAGLRRVRVGIIYIQVHNIPWKRDGQMARCFETEITLLKRLF